MLPSRKAESLLAPGSRTLVHQQKRARSAGQLTHRLAVFRTSDGRGWVSTAAAHPQIGAEYRLRKQCGMTRVCWQGGQALEAIPNGSFLCSYVGELITREESEARR